MRTYKATIPNYKLKKEKSDFVKVKIGSSEDAYNYIKQFYGDDLEIYESFFILLLNRANNTIGYVKISQGGTAGTVIDKKLIAKYAIESISHNVILAHNHPSGNILPSDQDKEITNDIKSCLSMFDINVLDHIILSDNDYFSFTDNGKI